MSENTVIPIIDLFAGPGGLGEGFSSVTKDEGERAFRIALSIEKDEFAHKTLTLRAFIRQFPINWKKRSKLTRVNRSKLTTPEDR